MASITIRVDEETKAAATKIIEDFGLDISTATRAFYRQIIRENRIPLNLFYPEPNDESLQSVVEAEAVLKEGRTGYKSAKELFEAMEV